MASTFLTGPLVVAGALAGNAAGSYPQEYGVEFGPSLEYQGEAILDVRYAPLNKDNPLPGTIPAHFNSPYLLQVDAIPAASAATPVNVAAAANVATGVAMTLVAAASWGVALKIPYVNIQTNAVATGALCLDLGWGMCQTTSGSTTVTVQTGTIGWYTLGQWIIIGQAATSTTPLIAQVTAIGTTTITVSVAAGNTNTSAPVGSANILSSLTGATATAHVPAVPAGVARLWDPQQCLARNVGIAGSNSAAGGAFKVAGADIYGNPMTETITHTSGTAVVYGVKAFKYINSVTPQFTDAHNYSVGTGDTFGFMTRSDRYETANLYFAAAFLTSAVSTAGAWTAADTTSPATAATGDTRGTFQVSARGANGTVNATTYSNGAVSGTTITGNRLAAYSSINLYNMVAATPGNSVPMYGVTPA